MDTEERVSDKLEKATKRAERAIDRLLETMQQFLKLQSASGLLLMLAAVIALVIANSPLASTYDAVLSTHLTILVNGEGLDKPILLWVNDGLMAIFFLLVGLEIKREVLFGDLSNWEKASLPVMAAVGGMAVPAAVYVAFNLGTEYLDGWAIPAATDIAFALGVLSLLGKRVPIALKVFLLALAIIDDIGAIVIIAVFYTSNLSITSLLLGAVGIVGLLLLSRLGVRNLVAYLLIALFLWICVLKSGVHATLAGVVAAAFIPAKRLEGEAHSPLEHLEHALHPWVAFGIMPLFAFANAGVSLSGVTFDALLAPLPLGIALGLFLGKQLGVFAFTLAAVKFGIARMPENVTWPQIYGVSMLTGIGFTMSLFIGTLAFDDSQDTAVAVRLGVLIGSLFSAVCGYLWLRVFTAREAKPYPR